MSLSNPDTVVTEQRLSDFYQAILPYIGGIEIADGFSSTDTRPLQNQVITKLFAENFDATNYYNYGDWVVYNGRIYMCSTAHSGAWDSNDFDEITISWIINQLEVNKADISDLDGWTSPQTATTVGSNVVVEFDDLSNSYGYDLYCEDTLVGIISMTKGTGTNTGIKLTYVLDGATSGVTSCKLRILK